MIHRSFLICLKKKNHTHKVLKGWGALAGEEVGMEQSWSLRDEGEALRMGTLARERSAKTLCS